MEAGDSETEHLHCEISGDRTSFDKPATKIFILSPGK